jgi:hypothetical protein
MSGVAGAATDTRDTSVTTRHAARAPELAAGAATNAGYATLPAGTAIRTVVLAPGTAASVRVTAAPTGILLEHNVCRRRARRCRTGRERFGCRHRRNSNRRCSSATYQRLHQAEFR